MSLNITNFDPFAEDIHVYSPEEEIELERLKHHTNVIENLSKYIFEEYFISPLAIGTALSIGTHIVLRMLSSNYCELTNTKETEIITKLLLIGVYSFLESMRVKILDNRDFSDLCNEISPILLRENDPRKSNLLILMGDYETDWNETFFAFYDSYIPFFAQRYNVYLYYPTSIGDLNKYLKIKEFSQILFGAHGCPNSIDFTPKFRLSIKDIPKLNLMFQHKPEILLCSCGTGMKGSIGERIAEEADTFVRAPADLEPHIRFLNDYSMRCFSKDGKDITRIIDPKKTEKLVIQRLNIESLG